MSTRINHIRNEAEDVAVAIGAALYFGGFCFAVAFALNRFTF
jgi:hypothetical protein